MSAEEEGADEDSEDGGAPLGGKAFDGWRRESEASPFVRLPLSSASRSTSLFMRNNFPKELAIVVLFSPILP